MNLLEFTLSDAQKTSPANGSKIPWDDPDFSRRMLEAHLSQEHDWASRRNSIIERHTGWIAGELLQGPAQILDLACGPGFYTQALATRGHQCVGVDFSPASIAYAREQARRAGLAIDYVQADIRGYTPEQLAGGTGITPDRRRSAPACAPEKLFDCILLTFGEFNVFTRPNARAILRNCARMLAKDGLFILEAHTYAAVQAIGEAPASWQRLASGLFSDAPHLCLQENSWNAAGRTALSRYYIVDAASAGVRQYASCTQAYTDEEYHDMFQTAGLASPRILDADLWPAGDIFQGKLQVFVAGR